MPHLRQKRGGPKPLSNTCGARRTGSPVEPQITQRPSISGLSAVRPARPSVFPRVPIRPRGRKIRSEPAQVRSTGATCAMVMLSTGSRSLCGVSSSPRQTAAGSEARWSGRSVDLRPTAARRRRRGQRARPPKDDHTKDDRPTLPAMPGSVTKALPPMTPASPASGPRREPPA